MDDTPVTNRPVTDVEHVLSMTMGAATEGVRELYPAFVSVKAAGGYLGGIVPREVYRLIERGYLQAVKIGRRRMIVVTSLQAYAQHLIERSDESGVNDTETAA